MHSVVKVEEWHIKELAHTIQQIDIDSITAVGGLPTEEAIRQSIKNSDECYTWVVDGKVGAIFGLSSLSLIGTMGCIWFLASNEKRTHVRWFLNECKKFVRYANTKYDVLVNYTDARELVTLRWAKWLGFTIYPAEPFGKEGRLFHRTELRKWDKT